MLSSLSEDSQRRARLSKDRVAALGKMIHQAQNALSSLLELATVDLTEWEEINERKTQQES